MNHDDEVTLCYVMVSYNTYLSFFFLHEDMEVHRIHVYKEYTPALFQENLLSYHLMIKLATMFIDLEAYQVSLLILRICNLFISKCNKRRPIDNNRSARFS